MSGPKRFIYLFIFIPPAEHAGTVHTSTQAHIKQDQSSSFFVEGFGFAYETREREKFLLQSAMADEDYNELDMGFSLSPLSLCVYIYAEIFYCFVKSEGFILF